MYSKADDRQKREGGRGGKKNEIIEKNKRGKRKK
jgi:hypothetical protein